MIAAQFVCLSMIVSGRAWHSNPHLTALDVFALSLQNENDGGELHPMIAKIYGTTTEDTK